MFVHVAIHRPKAGKDTLLIDSMHRLATAALRETGLQQVHTLMDHKSGAVISLAIWDSKEEWEAARTKMQDAVKNDRIQDWTDGAPEILQLEPV
jgi:hypothetical protein